MKSDRSGSPLRGLLSLVEANGGHVSSRISIQKSAYLLKTLKDPDFVALGFSYHHYGPYSRQLSDVLQEAVAAGLLQESRDAFAQGYQRYAYCLTEGGRSWLDEEFDAHPETMEKFGGLLSKAHWRVLELAATVVFLEKEELATERRNAFSMALRLKPECKVFRERAERLLDELGL